MDAEMASWKSTCTYVNEVPPPGVNIVDGMWIFRVKRPPGSLPAFKARYVARGFSQRQGVDYFQSFSPTPKMTSLRVLLHVAARRDYELHSLEFSTTILQGSLHKEIWLRRPPGFTGTTLAALGFAPSTADPSLFLRTDTSLLPFYVLVYVDDLVFATVDTEALTLVKSELQKRHTCTDLGELRSYLGLQITRERARRTITLTQSHMVHQVLQRFGFQISSPQLTPLSTSHSLSAPPSDESAEPSGPYPELLGCLMVQRYLCSTLGMGLVLGGRGLVVLTGHADASLVDDSAKQQSSQGYTFSLGSSSVSWRSTCSSSVLISSCEAEIYAGAMAVQELRWLTYLLIDLGEQPRLPPVLYVDNKAMIALCQEHRLEHRTKHIALRYFLARELQQRCQLRLAYVATRANTADVFTKALLRDGRNTDNREVPAEKLKAFSAVFEAPQYPPAEIRKASSMTGPDGGKNGGARRRSAIDSSLCSLNLESPSLKKSSLVSSSLGLSKESSKQKQREAGAKNRVERRGNLDSWVKRLKPSTADPARASPAQCHGAPTCQFQLLKTSENPYSSHKDGPFPSSRDPRSCPLQAAECTAALRRCVDAPESVREKSLELTQKSPRRSGAPVHPMPAKSPSCDLGSESCRAGSACDSPGRELMSSGSDDRRCDAPLSATCEEPIGATDRLVTYRRIRRVMADGGSRDAIRHVLGSSTPGRSVGDSPDFSPEACNVFTTKKAVASAAAATIPSGSSEERPRGTSTLAFWSRQGNGSGKEERSGGASCSSDVPRVDDEYEIQRLRKSKLKRKAGASTGEDEHRSTEEQQQQGLAQQRVGQLEQNIERRAEDERQEGVHEGREQTHSLRLQEELPTSPREAHTLLEQLDSERPEQLLQQRPQQKQQQQQRQRKQVQACLDFGQKDLLHTTCRVCGFVFAKGLKADEMAHDAHHRLFCGTVIIQGWRNERVVHAVSESTRDARNACSTGAGAAETAAGRIVLITHADCTAVQLAKVRYCALDSSAFCALQCTVLRCGAVRTDARNSGSVGDGNGCESHVAAAGTFLTSFALPLCALSPSRTMQMQEIAAVLERAMGVSPTWLLGGQWKIARQQQQWRQQQQQAQQNQQQQLQQQQQQQSQCQYAQKQQKQHHNHYQQQQQKRCQ
ncbi:unnamed protein product [Closterium sp. NIES-54]